MLIHSSTLSVPEINARETVPKKKGFPTIASEIQNLIKGCDDLVSDLRVHLSNIPSKLRANNRNMIGGVVELVSQRITSVR